MGLVYFVIGLVTGSGPPGKWARNTFNNKGTNLIQSL